MAVGLTAPPTWLHTSSLSSLVTWKRVQSRSRLSVRASTSSSWKHQVSKANDSPFKLSTVFLDILNECSESDLAALQSKDAEDWGTRSNNKTFIRRRRDSELEAIRHHEQEERVSSTNTEVSYNPLFYIYFPNIAFAAKKATREGLYRKKLMDNPFLWRITGFEPVYQFPNLTLALVSNSDIENE